LIEDREKQYIKNRQKERKEHEKQKKNISVPKTRKEIFLSEDENDIFNN
jgi:hypothetical protein